MKWEGRRKSTNVNDQRGKSGFSGRNVAVGGGGLGIIGLIVVVLMNVLGGGGNTNTQTTNPGAIEQPGSGADISDILSDILGGGVNSTSSGTDIFGDILQPGQSQQSTGGYAESEQERELFNMLSVALADIEDTWSEILPQSQYRTAYAAPQLTIFSGHVNTACGAADAGMGPFYCPGDRTIYLDLSFYDTLTKKYGAKEGDYAMVYVIAHEAGHHVQTLLGVTQQLNTLRQQVARGSMSQTEFNRYSVAFELQADYLAGVVARYMEERGYLERGDIAEAMSAAKGVGDDTLQTRYQGYADPDTFNHGTSAQRQEWYRRGYEAGDLSGWDTFKDL